MWNVYLEHRCGIFFCGISGFLLKKIIIKYNGMASVGYENFPSTIRISSLFQLKCDKKLVNKDDVECLNVCGIFFSGISGNYFK